MPALRPQRIKNGLGVDAVAVDGFVVSAFHFKDDDGPVDCVYGARGVRFLGVCAHGCSLHEKFSIRFNGVLSRRLKG